MGSVAALVQAGDSLCADPPEGPESLPLAQTLIAGGDDRLVINSLTGMNAYGCTPTPRAGVIAFSSSTASSISKPAYLRASIARGGFTKDALRHGADEAFDFHVDTARRALKTLLGLNELGTEVVFSASGTDAQLHAHFLTREILGTPLTTIAIGSDQTGSGTVYTSRARHFSNTTALGYRVAKGAVVDESASTSIEVPFIRQDGSIRSGSEIDAEVMRAVSCEAAAGCKVLLQTMETSKLGWHGPSDACIDAIIEHWPDSVQVVVDACQLRIGRNRLKSHLDRGAIVLITGSKFFMGPGFSGATLVPSSIGGRLASLDGTPTGLAQYLAKADLPPRWKGLRACLNPHINLGAWLRWEAALEEMGAYYALPMPFVSSLFLRLGKTLANVISSARSLELLREIGGCPPNQSDDELPEQTLLCFAVKGRDGALQHSEMVRLYRTLNADVARALPDWATDSERRLAAQACHIGQPVKLGGGRSVLRIALGARTASEAWSPDPLVAERNINKAAERCSTIVDKIDLLLRYGLAVR